MDRFFRFYPLIVLLEIFTIFGMNDGSQKTIQQCENPNEQFKGPQIKDGNISFIWGFYDFFENEELSENTETDSSKATYSFGVSQLLEFTLINVKISFPLQWNNRLRSNTQNKLFILFHCLKLHL